MTEDGSGAGPFDIFIIGGGVNGVGIARDAAGRGYRVGLAERDDLAQGASSGSTKLVHGGLRYLEHYRFRLVRESLLERERLWALAPHIIWPMRFILPHHKGLRPAWLLRLGLFLYDHIGGRKLLPLSRALDLRRDAGGQPLKPHFGRAFEYSDCWVEDARLVALNARDAAQRGAVVMTRTEVSSVHAADGGWRIGLTDRVDGSVREVRSRILVNAAGAWIDLVLRRALGDNDARHVRLVQGSHIVTRKLFDHDRCYLFQNADGRIVFAIPYERDFTLIGTTDHDFRGDPAQAAITAEETGYLLDAVNFYFRTPVKAEDIVWSFAAVRPLYDDGAGAAQEASRDYVLRADRSAGAPLLNVFGGKITTYRRLAEEALAQIDRLSERRTKAWTAAAPLPGGDFPVTGFAALVDDLRKARPWLDPALAVRLARAYGTEAGTLLADCADMAALGRCFGADLHAVEVDYLMDREWARTAGDILWRRSKLGLRLSADQAAALQAHMDERLRGD